MKTTRKMKTKAKRNTETITTTKTKRNEPHQFDNAPATAEMATQEQLDALREQLRDEVRNEKAVAAASMTDAIRKKPKIPPFDKNHVEISNE